MNRQALAYTGIIVLLIALLAVQQCRHVHSVRDMRDRVAAVTDTLSVTRDRLGRETATIGLIRTDYQTFRTMQLMRTDSLGRALQRLVTGRTISATLATQQLHEQWERPTTTIAYIDTGRPCRPTYVLHLDETYRHGTITAGADTFVVDLTFPERLTFEQEESRWSFIKPRTVTSRYTNSNPNVEITGLRTYTVRCDCGTKSWISFGIGSAAGTVIGYGIGRIR